MGDLSLLHSALAGTEAKTEWHPGTRHGLPGKRGSFYAENLDGLYIQVRGERHPRDFRLEKAGSLAGEPRWARFFSVDWAAENTSTAC